MVDSEISMLEIKNFIEKFSPEKNSITEKFNLTTGTVTAIDDTLNVASVTTANATLTTVPILLGCDVAVGDNVILFWSGPTAFILGLLGSRDKVLSYDVSTTYSNTFTTTVNCNAPFDSMPFVCRANRLIKVSGFMPGNSDIINGGNSIRLQDVNAGVQLGRVDHVASNNTGNLGCSVNFTILVVNPTAGANIYRLQQGRTGSGIANTVTSTASATIPAWCLIEDVGPA